MTTEEEFLAERSYQSQAEFLKELGSVCLHGPLPEVTQKRVMDCAFTMQDRCKKARTLIEENVAALHLARLHMVEGQAKVEAGVQIEWFGKLLETLD